MHAGMSEFLDEQAKGLTELVETFRKARVTAARKAALESAARIRALNQRVRDLARSGVRLSSISQGTAERLIELQSDIVTSALTDAAAQLQRIADTEHVRDLARGQAEVLQATRQRIVDDITRALTILKGAAGEAREVAKRATAAKPATPRKPVRRKAKRAATKPKKVKGAARKPRARARAKQPARTKRSS
jgi:phasin family protein